MSEPVLLCISIDTEEDNWVPTRSGVSVENVRELPRLQAHLRTLGARPTYFTNYQVLEQPWSRDIIRELHFDDDVEIAGHLHPWNTPPFDEVVDWRNSMMCNLPAELQRAKLEVLTERFGEVLDTRPRSFRTGRFGLGRETVQALIKLGYRVDSSVSPYVSWEEYFGPDYHGAPNEPYRMDGSAHPRQPSASGLVEVPISSGYSRQPFSAWGRVHRSITRPSLRRLRLGGVASRLGIVRSILLTPEVASTADMVTLSRRLLEAGNRHLMLFFHSPTLVPGLSPFAATAADVDKLYRSLADYVEALDRITTIQFATTAEIASQLMPDADGVVA